MAATLLLSGSSFTPLHRLLGELRGVIPLGRPRRSQHADSCSRQAAPAAATMVIKAAMMNLRARLGLGLPTSSQKKLQTQEGAPGTRSKVSWHCPC